MFPWQIEVADAATATLAVGIALTVTVTELVGDPAQSVDPASITRTKL